MRMAILLLTLGCVSFGTHPLLAQSAVWTSPEATVRIPLHDDWNKHDGRDLRIYAERQGRFVVGEIFARRAGGILRQRNLNMMVYHLGEVDGPESLSFIFHTAAERLSQSYQVVEQERHLRRGIHFIAYRFIHSGDPVTQAMILFMDRNNVAFMVEVTGHRRDEDILMGEARQIAHSIEH